jgi:hypothetical protein
MFAAKKSKLVASLLAAAAVSLAGSAAAPADSIVFSNGYSVNNPNVTCETDFDPAGNLAHRHIYVGAPTMNSEAGASVTSA